MRTGLTEDQSSAVGWGTDTAPWCEAVWVPRSMGLFAEVAKVAELIEVE